MLSVNVCQMVQDARLYGVMTTGLKCHQARCNQSVGHSSTIWDLSPSALSEPVLNLGHGLRGVSAKPGAGTAARRSLARTCTRAVLHYSALGVTGPRPLRMPGCELEQDPVAPVWMRSGFAPTMPKKGQEGLLCQEGMSGTCRRWLCPRAVPRSPPVSACAWSCVGLQIPPQLQRGSARDISPTSTNPSSPRGHPTGPRDLPQVLICLALVKTPALIFAGAGFHPALGKAEQSSGDTVVLGQSFPVRAERRRAPCHLQEQTLGLPLPSQWPGKSILRREVRDAFVFVHLLAIFFGCLRLRCLTNPILLSFPPHYGTISPSQCTSG